MATPPVSPPQPARASRRGRLRSFLAYLFVPHGKPGEIVIISHSSLFYWWPIWLVGFIMAGLTYWDNHRMAIVPPGTVAALNREVQVVTPNGEVKRERRDVLIVPEDRSLPTRKVANKGEVLLQPDLYMASTKNYGVLYVVILLLVIFITNVPLRGLWSVLIIISILMLSIIFAQAGLWEALLNRSKVLAIHINMGGYLFTSIALFITWLINFILFDRQFYMIFSPGQLRARLEIGEGETSYDTRGMTIQKQRSDLFRHWILGLGSGDLIVNTTGAQVHRFDLPNVLFVGRKVKEIEHMLRTMPVVRERA